MSKKPSQELLRAQARLAEMQAEVGRLANEPANPAERNALSNAAPYVTTGEFGKSRPFSFTKALGLAAGVLDRENCKVEWEASEQINKALTDTNSRHPDMNPRATTVVLDEDLLKPETIGHESFRQYKSLHAQVHQSDLNPEELAYRFSKSRGYGSINKTAMSYLTDTIGGALVAPPAMGNLIDIMRNKSVLNRVGATSISLPAQGRWVAPRVTGTTTGYLTGENVAATESNPTFGQTSMEAKKHMVNARIPNELFLYPSVSADALLYRDMGQTLALLYDRLGLYGTGNGGIKGLIYYTGTGELTDYAAITTPAPKGIGTDGNQVRPEDGFRMASIPLDRNFEAESFKWVCRETVKASILSYRADAVAAKDAAGTFVQALTRGLADGLGESWCGYKMVTSSQIRNGLTKGSNTNCSEVFGGCWEHCYTGLYGAVQFDTNDKGEAAFQADQTLLRAKLFGDVAYVHPGAFVWYKLVTQGFNS